MVKQIWHALQWLPQTDLHHLELYQTEPGIAARQVYFSFLWKVLVIKELIFLASPWVKDYINCAYASLSPSRLPSSALTENMSVTEGFQADNATSLRNGEEFSEDLNTSAYQGCFNTWKMLKRAIQVIQVRAVSLYTLHKGAQETPLIFSG